MRIYTANFSTSQTLPKDVIPIDITRYSPPYFDGLTYPNLAPKARTLYRYKHGLSTDTEYIKDFKLVINDNESMLEELSKLSKGKDIALVCYCGKDKFCHRHLIAEYLCEKHDMKITEFNTTRSNRELGKLLP